MMPKGDMFEGVMPSMFIRWCGVSVGVEGDDDGGGGIVVLVVLQRAV